MTWLPAASRRALMAFLALAVALFGDPVGAAVDDNWPRFLGPNGMPVSDGAGLPDTWSPDHNIEWSIEIPGMGWSSPIVWDGRIFVTTAVSDQPFKQPSLGVDFSNEYVAELQAQGLPFEEVIKRVGDRDTEFPEEIDIRMMLYCLDLETGATRWGRELHAGPPPVGRHRKNSYASETPVTDGEAVYVYFAHRGLFAYDLEGNELWTTPLESFPVYLDFGGGTSPTIHGDRIYIVNDNEEASFAAAFDKKTGAEIWRTARPGLGEGTPVHSAWSSPVVWNNDLRSELVTMGPGTAISYDLDGNELWRMGGMGVMPIPTPIASGGMLYLASGPPNGGRSPLAAIVPGATGDITLEAGQTSSEHVAWFDWKGGVYLSTPIVYRDALFVLQEKGILTKYDARSGEIAWKARIAPGAAAFTASPWAYDGKIFAVSEEGDTYVMGTGTEYELLATNSLDEFAMATPAFAGDRLLLRTQSRLWSIRD